MIDVAVRDLIPTLEEMSNKGIRRITFRRTTHGDNDTLEILVNDVSVGEWDFYDIKNALDTLD